jgi:hypothetical protein
VNSVVFTSVEAVAKAIGLEDRAAALSKLQPLPYSEAQIDACATHRPELQKYIAEARRQWLPNEEPHAGAAQEDTLSDPLGDVEHGRPPWLPWCRAYAGDRSSLFNEWAPLLLYDFRHSAVYSAGLHECRPQVCDKGRIGQQGFCRLGYWHWYAVPEEEHTWMRCHGKAISLKPEIGDLPPNRGVLITERHHPYFGRLNPAVAACCKCNHDLSVLLRFPEGMAQDSRKHGNASLPEGVASDSDDVSDDSDDMQDVSDDVDNHDEEMARQMASEINDATHYTTEYTGKIQPHIQNLFSMLQAGHDRLEQQFREDPELAAKGPAYRAARTLMRMAFTCQKRIHKSMQEMVNYILGYPEAYCTHGFRHLYYGSLLTMAETLFPEQENTVGTDCAEATEDIATVMPPLSPGRDAMVRADEEDSDACREDDDGAAPGPSSIASDIPGLAKLSFAHQRLDYEHRGPKLQHWPLYFYVAGVSRLSRFKRTDSSFLFNAEHPMHRIWKQQVLTKRAWRVPLLVGPTIPAESKDPAKRAALLLILFKPWVGGISGLLDQTDEPGTEKFASWEEALFFYGSSHRAEGQ